MLVVLLPTIGLGAFGGFEAVDRSREAARTHEVEARVERASALLRVKLRVSAENYSSGATATARALGLEVAGVDLIRSRRGPLVLEVNSTPGLEGVEAVCGVDVAGAVLARVEAAVAAGGVKPARARRRATS